MQRYDDETPKKSHQWAFIIYPGDSAPKNWKTILEESYLPIAISPLHDSDLKDDGTPDKPHRHVLVIFQNNTTSTVCDDLARQCHGTISIPISNAWNYYRYLDHDRETNKAKYNHSDIILLNGLSETDIKVLSKEAVRQIRLSIHQYIREHNICEYSDLLDGLAAADLELYDYACSNSILFNTYISSFRNRGVKQEIFTK